MISLFCNCTESDLLLCPSCFRLAGAVVLSVPGEVLCSRRVLVLLVTFDLWLSLCVGLFFVCVCVFGFWGFWFLSFVVVVVILLLLACWTWGGLGS